MVSTLGFMSWTIGSGLQNRKVGINTESGNAFESVKEAIRNQNGEFYILHTTTFGTDVGVADDVMSDGESSTGKSLVTTGVNKNVIDLTRGESSGFVNDVVVYGKGINGEDIMSRASHFTKLRTKISENYQFDRTLGADLDATATIMTVSTALSNTSSWRDNDYLLIGEELIRINDANLDASYSGITTVGIERAQTTGGGVKTAATFHTDFSEILYIGASLPAVIPTSRQQWDGGFACNVRVHVEMSTSQLNTWSTTGGAAGDLWLGDEAFTYSSIDSANHEFVCTLRGKAKTVSYEHCQGSPVVSASFYVDSPQSGSSISTYGIRAERYSLSGLWSRATADAKAEAILETMAFPKEVLTATVANPLGYYMTGNNGSPFETNFSPYTNTKNLNIMGHLIAVTDTYTGLSGSTNYRCTKEEFSFDKGSAMTLSLTLNPIVNSSYSSGTNSNAVGSYSSSSSFVDMLKNDIKTDMFSTIRSSDYNKKNYIQYDGSGGKTAVNGLLELDTQGLTFTPVSAAPPAIKGGMYFDSDTNKLYVSEDGTTWTEVGGGANLWRDNTPYLEPLTDGNGIALYDATGTSHFIVLYDDLVPAFINEIGLADYETFTNSGSYGFGTTSAYFVYCHLGTNNGTSHFKIEDSGGVELIRFDSDGNIRMMGGIDNILDSGNTSGLSLSGLTGATYNINIAGRTSWWTSEALGRVFTTATGANMHIWSDDSMVIESDAQMGVLTSDLYVDSGADIRMELGDAGGTRKLYVYDSAHVDVFDVNSDGVLSCRSPANASTRYLQVYHDNNNSHMRSFRGKIRMIIDSSGGYGWDVADTGGTMKCQCDVNGNFDIANDYYNVGVAGINDTITFVDYFGNTVNIEVLGGIITYWEIV